MKRLLLWGFIFMALFGQAAFAKDQLKCSLIESDDSSPRENITLFTNDKKPGDPSFKIITIKLEEEMRYASITFEAETFSKCSTNSKGVVIGEEHIPSSSTDCKKNGAMWVAPDHNPVALRKFENAHAFYNPKSGEWSISTEYAWLEYKFGSQELIGLRSAARTEGSYACY